MPTSTKYAKYSGIGGGSGGGGVTSLNGETGAVILVAGTGISITPSGQNITIANTEAGGSVTSVSVVTANGLAGTVANPTTTPAITLSTTITGILQGNGTAISAATTGNLTDVGTDGIVVTGGTGAVLGTGTSLAQHVADTTHNGYLSSADWNTFNGKQAAGNYITAITGDLTATGPGSVPGTLATVNSNVGSFGSSTSIPSFTVNGKGLITAASGNVVIAPAGTLTGTTLASNVVTSSLTSLGVQSQALNMGSHLINAVTDPVSAQDAATKNYVDTVASGLQPIQGVQAATAGSNISGTYANGAAGIGATFTTTSTATFVVDGFTFTTLGQRLLLKDQSSGFQNGVYSVTQLSTGVLPTILTRTLDYDTASDMNAGTLVPVINGTVNAQTSWLQTANITTVGTDALVFVQWTANPANYLLKANNLTDVASKSTSFNTLSPMTTLGDIIYENATPSGTRLPGNTTSTKNFMTQTGTGSVSAAPAWGLIALSDLPGGTTSVAYAQSYFSTASSWSTTSTSFADGTNSGGNALTGRLSSGLTLAAAASNVCGITFTPRSASAVYSITVISNIYNFTAGATSNIQMLDGSGTIIISAGQFSQAAGTAAVLTSMPVEGIYSPGTTSPVTVRLQLAASAGTAAILSSASAAQAVVEWIVEEIPTNIIGSSLGLANFGSSPNAQGASVSSSTLTLQPASASFPGGVSTTTQTFAGAKSISTGGGSTTAFNIDSPAFVFDSTNFALGINNTPSTATFIDGVNSSGATKRLLLTGYGTASLVGMRTRLARNTSGSPQAVQNGDILGFYNAEGYGTSQFPATATGAFTFTAAETFTNTSNATYATINTTPSGAVTSAIGFKVDTTGQVSAPAFYTTAGTLYTDATGKFTAATASGNSFFTSGTTYTTPASTTAASRFKFTLVGGGASGAGSSSTANTPGAGGGAGGSCIVYLTGLTASTGYTMAIGTGGAGGSNTTGNAGGNTTISINAVTYTASGGSVAAGVGGTQAGGAGGSTTNATIGITGQAGGSCPPVSAAAFAGYGGSSHYGMGGASPVKPATGGNTGNAGTGFGSGGSGGVTGAATGAATTGGAGAGGMILVEWNN